MNLQIRMRPRWARILRAPMFGYRQYRTLRKHGVGIRLAAFCAWHLVRFIVKKQ